MPISAVTTFSISPRSTPSTRFRIPNATRSTRASPPPAPRWPPNSSGRSGRSGRRWRRSPPSAPWNHPNGSGNVCSKPSTPQALPRRRRRLGRFRSSSTAIGVGSWVRQDVTPPPTSAQILAADDVRTTSGSIEGGGTATVVYSKEVDAGVLVMNNVTPPSEGTVYQMWLISPEGMTSAGTMTPDDVAPSTTAVLDDLSGATALGFSVEPTGGSTQPSSIFAELPLT
ncbi:anti-sigma factor [Rhodococcus sp. CX]|nr:anti-sigma factor [Rhodococcus sp. CX]MBH0120427.1 anti-sigma factor [Rhodococcus sp. CX]